MIRSILVSLLVLPLILPAQSLAWEPASKRPNIVLIMADDLGWMDLHCQGNKSLDTPHLDRLAEQGIRLTSGYAASPVCTPTRAAIMTGQTPARLKITNHAPGNPNYISEDGLKGASWNTYLPLESRTLAEHLSDAGYATGFFGKWHLSHRPGQDEIGKYEPRLRPEHQGFSVNMGGCRFGGPPTYFDPYRIPGIAPRKKGEYLTDRLADESIAFVKQHQNAPFFLCWWSYGVHYPFEAPAALIKKYEQRNVENATYAAMIEAMDASIGRLLAALDELDLEEDTFLLFTSDNGSFLSNQPLRQGKGHLYEGGIRVPWIVRWPKHIRPETTSDTPVISTDIFPTLLELAGVESPSNVPGDGESLLPMLTSEQPLEREALYFHYPNYAFHKENRLGCAIRAQNYKLIQYFDDNSVELFDLSQDLSEQHDLSQELPGVSSRLQSKLASWLTSTGANLPTRRSQQTTTYRVTAPPENLNLPAFYQKYVSASGYPIVASAKVNDFALKEAAYLIDMLLAERADVREAMIDNGSRMIVMGHGEYTTDIPEYAHMKPKNFWDARARGLGGSRTDPVCSSAEENLLAFPGDPYRTENILIHEFAHNIHLRGMLKVDATFDDRLKLAYEKAINQGLWKGKYASVNRNEYFAEGVQSWFNNNRPPDHDHNHVDTREELFEYDPGLAELCKEVFGNTKLKYTSPLTRLTGHLKGYDPNTAPRFQWPERLAKSQQEIRESAESRSKN